MTKYFKLRQTFSCSGAVKWLLFLWAILSAPIVLADALSLALQEIDKGNYEQAYHRLEPMAQEGNAEAQYLIGHMLIDEVLSLKDQQKGLYWLDKAAQNKHSEAAQTLSKMYLSGLGVPLDVEKGTEYMQLAKEYQEPDEDEEECD